MPRKKIVTKDYKILKQKTYISAFLCRYLQRVRKLSLIFNLKEDFLITNPGLGNQRTRGKQRILEGIEREREENSLLYVQGKTAMPIEVKLYRIVQ